MSRVWRARLSLRLFMLLCLGAGALVAWAGLVYQRGEIEQSLQPADYKWQPLGRASEWFVNRHGEVIGATIKHADDWEALRQRIATSKLEYLAIRSPGAFRALRPQEFPNLRKLSLGEVDLDRGVLSTLSELPKLHFLLITELGGDPVSAMSELESVATLRQLVLCLHPDASLDEFPALRQLRALTLSHPNATSEQLSAIRERLPDCVVSGPTR
jgi:hypothetical protein